MDLVPLSLILHMSICHGSTLRHELTAATFFQVVLLATGSTMDLMIKIYNLY
ncbi:MAG: hypothetical protein KZQ78_07170 [Candidatus Thiodiazotropha sp. (ex Ustalcina ferruginea)]|nr:hypothetical protein [Candidatus Thiodiazotropha sp. (ex Ustalcina ferruginea)]